MNQDFFPLLVFVVIVEPSESFPFTIMLNNIGYFSQFFDDLGTPDVLDPTGIFPWWCPLNPYKSLPGKSRADLSKRHEEQTHTLC